MIRYSEEDYEKLQRGINRAKQSKIPPKPPKTIIEAINPVAHTKYRNVPTISQSGEKYRSKKEMKRHEELLLGQRGGVIKGLKREVPFRLLPRQTRMDGSNERECSYIADFTYRVVGDWVLAKDGDLIVEDVKSPASRTPLYILKRKLMLYIHGITIRET